MRLGTLRHLALTGAQASYDRAIDRFPAEDHSSYSWRNVQQPASSQTMIITYRAEYQGQTSGSGSAALE
jgi:hypothetical protein